MAPKTSDWEKDFPTLKTGESSAPKTCDWEKIFPAGKGHHPRKTSICNHTIGL
jgi:hypothetical protein